MIRRGLRDLTAPLAGRLAVALLRVLGRLPLPCVQALGAVLLPFYRPFRRATGARLRALGLRPRDYYRARLRLAALSLRHVLGRPDGLRIEIEGAEFYAAALATGRPVALLGWHQGPVELLHRIPSQATSRPFFVMTAGAFAPALAGLMKDGRGRPGAKVVIRPDSLSGLRAWERDKGVLAVMVDQVRGRPEEWLTLRPRPGVALHVPWPKRLLEWVQERRPELLTVSVRLEGKTARFRYAPLEPDALKEALRARFEAALRENPLQYNASYPKLKTGA